MAGSRGSRGQPVVRQDRTQDMGPRSIGPKSYVVGVAARRAVVSLVTVVGLVSTLSTPQHVEAGHGGVVELNRAPAGPYLLSVWTQPSPATVGAWHVDIAVMGEGGAPVTGATVRVRMEPLER